jgi:hypothetical protein
MAPFSRLFSPFPPLPNPRRLLLRLHSRSPNPTPPGRGSGSRRREKESSYQVADGKTFLKMSPGNHSTTSGYCYLATGGDRLMYRVEIQRAGIYFLWVKDANDAKHPAESRTRSVRHSVRDSSQDLSNVVFESWLWGTGFSSSRGGGRADHGTILPLLRFQGIAEMAWDFLADCFL